MNNKRVHGCDIVGEIGTGGMAIVYKAVQNSLNRPVAIKELRPDFANDPQIVARFVREATSLAALQHQNIVHIYDFFQEENTFRMLLEYVEGIDLFDLLDRVGRLPLDIALIIAHEVCSALEYAHYRGIIHRDIKPSNIIISRMGEVKLMDFGIARDENLGDLTRPGTSLGTPAYMSPEQIMGLKIDFRSDIFSLGVVLYQMLTGQKPFYESDGKSIMHKILAGEYIRPRRLNPDLPRAVERIIQTCLQKEPADRFSSTGELRRQIEKLLAPRVKMNFAGRMVVYLYHQGLLSRPEAEVFVQAEQLEDQELSRRDANLPPRLSFWMITGVQAALGLLLVLWFFISQWVAAFPERKNHAAAVVTPGSLKVVAWPWAEIYIDGAYVDTTPVARAFSLSPGVHLLELKNPHYKSVSEKVLIEPARVLKKIYHLEKNSADK